MNILTIFAISAPSLNIPVRSADQVLQAGLNIAYFIAGVIAVIAIILAGFSYVTSQGDAGRITKAKNTILYAVIGIVVILSAFAITQFVIGRF